MKKKFVLYKTEEDPLDIFMVDEDAVLTGPTYEGMSVIAVIPVPDFHQLPCGEPKGTLTDSLFFMENVFGGDPVFSDLLSHIFLEGYKKGVEVRDA